MRSWTQHLSAQALDRVRSASTAVALLVLVNGASLLASASGSPAWESTATAALISVSVVVGLYLFVGLTGVMSFGHIAFMAIGAYVTAWLTMPSPLKETLLPGLPSWLMQLEMADVPAILIAATVAAFIAFLAAIPLMRLSGIQAGIGTLSLLVIVYVLIGNADELTRGQLTLAGVPLNTTLSRAALWASAAVLVAFMVQVSSLGARLRASREDEFAAAAVGVNVRKVRTLAFIVSAFVVGAAGGVYGQFLGTLNPDAFYINLTVITVAMLVIGGVMSLSGAVVGALSVSLFIEVLRKFQADGIQLGDVVLQAPSGSQQVALGIVLLAVLILRPTGLTGGREIVLIRPRTRTAKAYESEESK